METNKTDSVDAASAAPRPPSTLPVLSAYQADTLFRSGLAIAVEMIEAAFPAMCQPVVEGLIARMDADASAPIIRRLVAGRATELRDTFIRRLRLQQDDVLSRVLGKPRAANSRNVTAETMTLLDADAAGASMAVEKSASRVRGAVDELLRELHVLVGYLAGREQLRPADDPFAPDVFMNALVAAGDDLGIPSEDAESLATAFERVMADELRRVYLALLDHFRRHSIDAKAIRRELAARQAAMFKGGPGAAATKGGAALSLAPDGSGAVTGPGTLGGGGPGGVAAPGGVGIPLSAAAALSNILARLQAGVRGTPPPAGLPSLGTAPAALLDAVQELQRLGLEGLAGAAITTGASGEVGAWREHLLNKSTRTVDKLTIEIVGMLFDHVLQDKQVPVEIKALISRLQFPVLKVALLDADFFASGNNPVRRLIDRIASTSIGWEPYGDENERYRAEVERVVTTVLDKFDKDVSIFEKLLAEFDTFVGETATKDNDPVARAKRALEDAEKREILVINTTIQVRRAFEKVELEPYLRDFLVGPWVQALVSAIMRDEQTPGFSKNFRQVIHDLVWSVQPKVSADERKRLVALIPPTMRVLRDGLSMIRMPEHDQNQFFQQMMQSHAMAVRPVDQATYIKSSLVTTELKSRIDEMRITGDFPITTVAGGVRISEGAVMRAAEHHAANLMMPPALTDMAPIDRDEEAALDERIANWQRGIWFELWNGKEFVRARLRWVSPLRTLFMFSCGQEQQARVLAPDVLKSYLKRGYLKPLEAEPLMKRAVEGVVDDFERMPKRREELASRFVT